ncbi:hypothetical protein QBC42DRAFT_251555 [Cladorrhinum samala]|uniref:Uncharacterized protein n=1 Tax=Cladorrhinum samala TaxID=585594 RepID=A0AAV9HNL1_9PEZI|nr:hypothetical protein QBC42DRAFT_251555 [Cladorrhinum samala]
MTEIKGVVPDGKGITQILTPPANQTKKDSTALIPANLSDRDSDGTTNTPGLSPSLKSSDQGEVSPDGHHKRRNSYKPVIVESSSYKPTKLRLLPVIISSAYNAGHLYQHRQRPPAAVTGLPIPPVINYTGKSLEQLVQDNMMMLGPLAPYPSPSCAHIYDLNPAYRNNPPYPAQTPSYYHPSFLNPAGNPMLNSHPGQRLPMNPYYPHAPYQPPQPDRHHNHRHHPGYHANRNPSAVSAGFTAHSGHKNHYPPIGNTHHHRHQPVNAAAGKEAARIKTHLERQVEVNNNNSDKNNQPTAGPDHGARPRYKSPSGGEVTSHHHHYHHHRHRPAPLNALHISAAAQVDHGFARDKNGRDAEVIRRCLAGPGPRAKSQG